MNSWRNFLSLYYVAVAFIYIFGTSLQVAQANINECSNSLHNCSEFATCNNYDGGYNCSCMAGFIGDGVNCTDINECTNISHNCSQFSACHNYNGGYNCNCTAGYVGDGVNCTDINECKLHNNCSKFATCHNNEGGYNCSCNNGFVGNGFNCSDVDECRNSSHSKCSESATCHNYDGGYNCSCTAGYIGDGMICTDINECLQLTYPCSQLAVCKNTVGKFHCNCSKGYSGNGTFCEDINECTNSSHTCSEFAKCTNNDGGYECDCKDGFVGDGFSCLEKPIIDYNTEVHVQQNMLYGPYFLDLEISAFGHIYRNIYVSGNGYITLGENSRSYAQPGDGSFPKSFSTFAPFWTAFDIAASGKIFIDNYKFCEEKQIFKTISKMISSTFNAKRAVVITWENVSPYPESVFGNETITFQSILVSNGTLFYVIFNYNKDMVKLNADANRDILVGYSDGKHKSVIFARNKQFFQLLQTGNETYGLRKTFKIGDRQESSLNCLEWHCESKKQSNENFSKIPCPCTVQQASLDPAFKSKDNGCYENRFPLNGTMQRCCYSKNWQALLKNFPGGGFTYNANKTFSLGHKYCCEDYSLCNLFYDIYPSDTCSNYEVPVTVYVLDPLVFNMINKNWISFYGAGEYTLLTVTATPFDTRFTIQVRVELKDNEQFSKVPVYTAFAIKFEAAVLEITQPGNVDIIENGTDSIFEIKENNSIFFNNMHLEIISGNDSMGIILTIPHYLINSLSGLLTGKLPNEQSIDQSSRSEVYNLWKDYRVKENYSFLTYALQNYSTFNSNNISENQFIKILSNLSDLVNTVNVTGNQCQTGDMLCIYAIVLKKRNLAHSIMFYKPEYFKEIENFPPFLQNTVDKLYLKPGNISIFLKAVDRNNDNFNIKIEGIADNNFTFENGNLNWSPNLNKLPISLKVWAVDDSNASSLYWPELLLCNCKENGFCKEQNSSERMYSITNNNRFYILPCTCIYGYTGRVCNEMIDFCSLKPCYTGVACNSSLGENDMCGSCPKDFYGNGRVCYDQNFCSKGVCSQKCQDNIGDTYVCSCRKGYKLGADNRTCEDINECNMPTRCNNIGQYCFNTPASFQCKCKKGYIAKNYTCEILANKNKFSGSMTIVWLSNNQRILSDKLTNKSSEEFKIISELMEKSILKKIGKDNVVLINNILAKKGNRTKRSIDLYNTKILFTVYGETINQNDLESMLKSTCNPQCCDFNSFCVIPSSIQIFAQSICNDNICDSLSTICKVEQNGFKCVCKPGFQTFAQYSPFRCQDIDECNTTLPCGSVSCQNTFGSYKCLCEFGHVFKDANKSCADACAENPCKNGNCIKLKESYRCSCYDGWSSEHCDQKDKESNEFRTALIAVGVVLGFLCLTLIGVIAYMLWKYKRPSCENNLTEDDTSWTGIPRVNVKNMNDDENSIKLAHTKASNNIYSNTDDSGKVNPAYQEECPRQ